MNKADNKRFEEIIAKIGLPKSLLKNIINAFKGQQAPYPGHEIYGSIEKEIHYSDLANKPQTADELLGIKEKKKYPSIEEIASVLSEESILEFVNESKKENIEPEDTNETEITFCLLSEKGQKFLEYLSM